MNRKMLAVAILFLFGIFSVIAQTRQLSADQSTRELADSLALSNEQMVEVRKIYQKAMTDLQANFETNIGDEKATLAGIRKISRDTDNSIDSILNVDQKVKFISLRAYRDSSRTYLRSRPSN